jgi:glycosyltransferase involved in cell wall biosynthesis
MVIDRLPTYVRGWALFPSEPVARVELEVDGRMLGRARLGLPRPDVAAEYGWPDAPIAGWEFELDEEAGLAAGGRMTLGGTVYGSSGRTWPLPDVGVELAAAPPRLRAAVAASDRGPARRRSPPSNPLNLLVFTHSLSYGGAQLYLVELLERLAGRGMRATVVAPADGPLRDRLERASVAVRLVGVPEPWRQHAYDARVAELVSFAATREFDLVIVNTIGVFHGLEVGARLGVPTILAAHESLDPRAYWAYHLHPYDPGVLDRFVAAFASMSAAVFEAAATRELFLPYAAPDRLITLPYGIELAAIDRFRSDVTPCAARAALGIEPGEKVVLCLGTVEPRKAQASLARAFARVADRDRDAMLAIVGRDEGPDTDDYADGLIEYLRRTELLGRVAVIPPTSDPYTWHLAADVLVCASDNESLPRVILEAMAFGTLVVATDIFGVPEVIEDGVTGFLCASRDEDDLAAKLDEALVPRPEHAEISAAAAARVHERHDADAYVMRFLDVVDAVLQRESGAGSPAA